jgi:peptide/nickel transport system substrate-binding protein
LTVAEPVPAEGDAVLAPEGIFGGTIRYALSSTQTTLDVHKTTTGSREGALQAQETLFAFDENLVPRPNLVTSWTSSEDGLNWEFKLKDGIKYHNGKAFDSTDAVKSYERWLDRDNFGQIVAGFIDRIDTPDDLTFTMVLNEPTGLLLDSFARIGGHEPVMMPPSMYGSKPAEGPPPGDMSVFSGTGAYVLKSWDPGINLVFERYEDYKSPGGTISFRAGPKFAYADRLEGIIIPELGSRVAALETGDVHYIGIIPGEQRARLQSNSDIVTFTEPTSVSRSGVWPNHLQGPFSDPNVRRALMLAYPVEDALIVISGSRDLFQACASLILCGNSRWGGMRTAGDEIYYGQRDLATAKQLVIDAGVVGEEITLLSVKGDNRTESPALITKKVLEDLGFTVDFQAVDRATYSERRSDPAIMDLFHTAGGMNWGGISPLLNSTISKDTYWNKYQDPSGQFTAKLQEFARSDAARQDELIREMQEIFFQDLQYIPIGETFPLFAMRKELNGVRGTLLMSSLASYVNAWIEK